jgi:phosphatidylserine/phosphatidylglycerophosphate/cardiolipin synthase-like enzyme
MKRVVRKSRAIASGEVRALIQTALVAELLSPSDVIWVVSPWINDVPVISNDDGRFRAILPQAESRDAHLSEVLAALAQAGTTVVVAVRPDRSNDTFLTTLRSAQIPNGRLVERHDAALHEKTLAGDRYVITGSMNFTRAGIDYNEEQVTFDDDVALVAEVRAALRQRWGPA